MSKQKHNIFSGFNAAALEREQEQDYIEVHVTGIEPEDLEPSGRSGRGRKSAAITLSISQEDKTLVKTFAVQRRTTVSELFHQWIQEHCG